MAMNEAVTKIRVVADTTSAVTGLKALKTTMGAIAGSAAAGMIVDFLRQAREASQEYKLAVNQLTAGLGYYSSALVDQAKALEKSQYVHAEETLQAQARLALYFREESEIKKLIPAVLDLARAKGMDLVSAANMLAISFSRSSNAEKASSGTIRGLGIEYRQTGNRAKDLEAMIEAVREKTKGQSQAVTDSLDGWDKLKFKLHEVTEEFGKFLFGVSKAEAHDKGYQMSLTQLNADMQRRADLEEQIAKIKRENIKVDVVAVGAITDEMNVLNRRIKLNQTAVDAYTKEQDAKKDAAAEANKNKPVTADTLDQAEKISIKAREEVLKESLDGRLQLLKDQYATERALLVKAGESTVYLDRSYAIARQKVSQEDAEKTKKAEESAYDDYRQRMEKEAQESFNNINNAREIRKQTADKIAMLDAENSNDKERIIELQLKSELEIYKKYADEGIITKQTYLDIEKEMTEKANKEKETSVLEHSELAISLAQNTATMLSQISDSQINREIGNLDKKKLGEKRYNKERDKLLKEQEQRERTFARMQQAIILGETIMDIAKGTGTALKKGFLGIPEWMFVAATGALQIATIQAQKFATGFLGEPDRLRRGDTMSAQIGKNEAVIPAQQYGMHEEDVRAIVNNTANTAAGMRALKGGAVVHNYYGLSNEQVIAVQRDAERRRYTGRLI